MAGPSHDSSTTKIFREKVSFMKNWKPENIPSNRDRLELYALHKQAISGDAPNSFSPNAPQAEKSRYQAWKHKSGLSSEQAMSAYCAECDRQLRVYGGQMTESTPMTPMTTPNESAGPNTEKDTAPRGIAAIPLLCAAAAESRVAYLRRLARGDVANAWWSRQEPLCGTPGTITTLPETFLLAIASLIESISLRSDQYIPISTAIVQSFLWPLHNISLAFWILLILLYTAIDGAKHLATTLLWGSRRTGLTLSKIWDDEIALTLHSVKSLCLPHHPIGVRLVALMMWPFTLLVEGLCLQLVEPLGGTLTNALVYVTVIVCTWWYWIFTVPCLAACTAVGAFWSGFCFSLIELARV